MIDLIEGARCCVHAEYYEVLSRRKDSTEKRGCLRHEHDVDVDYWTRE